ncbi:MAG TPA: hypothetical protein VGB08_11720 [Allosphingosinicella sp.]|jgi:hypothetical protein
MRTGVAFLLLAAAGCTAAPAPEAAPPPELEPEPERPLPQQRPVTPDRPRGPPPVDPPFSGFSPPAIRDSVEWLVAWRLGEEALRLARAAPTSIMVTSHQGLPRPVQNPDGSWGYEPPGANAMVRGSGGWTGWVGTERRPVSVGRAAEIDRILADRAFWTEPDEVPPTCTDAGARRLVIRHQGRLTVRQQSCGSTGLTGRLWELVYGGPG